MMRRTMMSVLGAATLLMLAACGGGTTGTGGRVISVTIDGAPVSGQLEVAATIDLDATVDATGGASTAVTWTSSDPSAATVDSSGKVTGVAVGTTTITATSTFDGSKSDSVTLDIIPVGTGAVTSVDITPANVAVNAGDTVQLSVVVNGNAGVSQAVSWASDDAAVANVDGSGLVTGVATGTATITATSVADPSKSGTAVVTVVSCGAAQELGHITAPTTLTGVAGCTDYLVNQFEVNVTAPLTIQPGVTIAFEQGARLDVEAGGSITANGTAAEPITFTGQAAVNGFWDGMRVNSAIPSTLENVVIAYAGGDGSGDAANLEIGSGGAVNLQNSTLRNSANYGLTVHPAGNLTGFSNNTLRDNKITARVRARHIPQLDSASSYAQGNTTNLIDVDGGNTDADGTWPATDAPYRLIAFELNVVNAITVADGVDFRFQAGSRLDIETGGSLTATGSTAGITFRGASQLPGFWYGVRIYSAIPSTFDGVTFADGGGDGSSDAAVVEVASGGRASFQGSAFRGSGKYGLVVQSSGELTGFGANDFSGNGVPMRVSARHIPQLDSASTFATDNTENFIDVDGGSTDAAGTWRATQAPYRSIAFEINVVNAITVEDGVEFRFQEASRLDVETGGSLSATGTSSGITFRGVNASPGFWTGIRIYSAIPSTLDGVTVSHGGGGGSSNAANLYVSSGALTLTNSVVNHSANYGLYVTGSSASVAPATEADMLSQNTFASNTGGDVAGLP